jgi:hypothetical protein
MVRLLQSRVVTLFMSEARIEFLQVRASAREPGAHSADWDRERNSGVLVARFHPGAEREHGPLALGKLPEQAEDLLYLLLIVELFGSLYGEVGRRVERGHPLQRRCVTALGAVLVADDVRRDPVQPGKHFV